jgi:DUF438 domain-containing protein
MDQLLYDELLEFVLHLDNPKENRARLEKVRPYFDTLSAKDVMRLVDDVMKRIDDIERIKIIVTRLLHSFSKSINRTRRDFDRTIKPIETLLKINDTINNILASCSNQLKSANTKGITSEKRKTLLENMGKLEGAIEHYKMKEYQLFPLVERYIEEHRCVSLMWAIHDDIRQTITTLTAQLQSEKSSLTLLNKTFGTLFFDVKSMIMREEQILYPIMIESIPRNEFLSLAKEQFEDKKVEAHMSSQENTLVDLITGNPSVGQIIQMFNHLTLDITYIDKDDKVVYFNTPEHRFFKRSISVIGRTVQNCHPPKSVHIVEKILKAFKDGSKDEADFVITMGQHKVRILYKAIRDENGKYEGTLEMSQEISAITHITEDKRLLDWE